ncbi:hypothetical protein H6F94_22260 [Leptolyngbya sp. FACHB-261]|nr:hypothetical protein [Leptolyngbya sp. FACHB-261]
MNFMSRGKQLLTVCVLFLVLTLSTACGGNSVAQAPRSLPSAQTQVGQSPYSQLERGTSATGANFGEWVVQKSRGMVKDAFVRDDNKLGVVIAPQVRPTEVRDLASSLVQGFRRNFPERDLKVLVYAPDKKLILTANYDDSANRIEYE